MPNIEVPAPDGFFDFLKEELPPEGFYTASQLAKQYGLNRSSVSVRMEKLAQEGKVVRRNYRVRDGKGRMQMAPHYGPPG